MTTQHPRDPGGGDPQPAMVLERQAQQRAFVAQTTLRRRRRVLVPLGTQASPPIVQQVDTSKVVLQYDFLNVVGSSSGVQVEVTRDADGRMRFWFTIADGSLDIIKLLGSGLNQGSMLACDGSSWVLVDPPVVKSRMTHDGGATDMPYWDPV